jgi:hypothetical protein
MEIDSSWECAAAAVAAERVSVSPYLCSASEREREREGKAVYVHTLLYSTAASQDYMP